MSEAEERELRIAITQADLLLKTKQSAWETPKAIAIIVATTAALFGTLAGLAGKLGQQPTQTIVIQQAPPQR